MTGDYLKRTPLSDAEIDMLAVLRLVHAGTVAKVGTGYYHEERPVLSWLEGPLDEAIVAGLVFLGEARPEYGFRRRATLTEDGLARYRELWSTQFHGEVMLPINEITEIDSRWTLDSEEHLTCSALQRIHGGRVAKHADRYLDGDQPMGMLTGATFAMLIERGLAVLGDRSPQDSLTRLSLTDRGRTRYAELGRVQFPASLGGE